MIMIMPFVSRLFLPPSRSLFNSMNKDDPWRVFICRRLVVVVVVVGIDLDSLQLCVYCNEEEEEEEEEE